MAYIGKEPIVGNFQKCDAISVVNGQAAYTLQVSSTNVSPESANHMLVSLNGILQAPTTSFTVSGSTLTFASNLATGDVIDFVMLLGNVLDLGVPSDATVSTAKIVDGAVTSAKLSAGKVLQVLSTVKTDTFSTASETPTFTDVTGLSVSITPSSTSSKILIFVNMYASGGVSGMRHYSRLVRGSTAICVGDSAGSRLQVSAYNVNERTATMNGFPITFLDSPNTTSSTTYKVQVTAETADTIYINRSGLDSNADTYARTASTITVMEVAG